jgi:3-oxoadipate enol-lactonase
MPMLTIAGEAFHYRLDGPARAPVLMLSNSLGTDMSMWDLQIPDFSKEFRVLRYDSRGHGKSPVTPGPYSIGQLAQDAINILDSLKISKTHWCGLSKGGMVGQWLMTHHGHRFGKAVFANTAAMMGPPDAWNTRIRTIAEKGLGPIAEATPDRWFTKEFQNLKPEVVAAIKTNMLAQRPEGYAACCAAIRDMDQRWPIRAIKNPVLVVIGAKDPATPPAKGVEIASNIKGSKRISLDAAHLSNIEQPKAFSKAVLDFLK